MKKNTMKKGNKVGKAIAVGAGVAAAGAAAYMLLGPDGKKNRAKVKAFAKKVQKKVTSNKEVMAMASMVAKAAKGAKTKAKAGVKKAKSVAKSAMKKGASVAKKTVKKAVSKAKRAAR